MLWILVPFTCCGVPIWFLTAPTAVQRDFDNIKPGMTVDQLLATFPHQFTVDPAFESSPTLPEYFRRNGSLRHFSGFLQEPGGKQLRFRGNLLDDELSKEEMRRFGIKPNETALQFVAHHPQWRVREMLDDHRRYFQINSERREDFSGKLSHLPDAPLWRTEEMTTMLVIIFQNGRVSRTVRHPFSD